MRFNDATTGAAVAMLGGAVAAYGTSLPSMAGQQFGAGLFPIAVGGGLVLCGTLLVVRGYRSRHDSPPATGGAPVSARGAVLTLLTVIGGLGFLAAATSSLGILITLPVALTGWLRLAGVKSWLLTIGVASVTSFTLHAVFYSVLRVPLPWGLLGRFAW